MHVIWALVKLMETFRPCQRSSRRTTLRTPKDLYLGPIVSMHRQSAARLVRQSRTLLLAELPPPYLAPSLHFSQTIPSSNFSSTAVNAARRGRDLSKNRGVSAIHRTGPKHPLGVSKYPLPKPVDPGERPPRDPTPNHGLWEFFPRTREALSTPEYDVAHGL